MDKARSAYYNFNTEQKWGAAQNYDLCLNVSQWGTDGSVELILRALRQVYLDLC
jgi:cytidylate kinase